MSKTGQPYTSGIWMVKDGKEDEFVRKWTEFVEWSLEAFPGFDPPVLIRKNDEPRRFVSFGGWPDADTVQRWRQHPDFPQKLGAARELCDEFVASDYTVAAAPRQ